jgi:hypothetical protein
VFEGRKEGRGKEEREEGYQGRNDGRKKDGEGYQGRKEGRYLCLVTEGGRQQLLHFLRKERKE